jgi:hypothetical protein
METQTTALQTKQANQAVALRNTQDQEILASSILVPRLHMMQGLSELVSEGKAHVGDIMKLPNNTVVAKKGANVEFIPLVLHESWLLEEKVGNKFEYRGREARDVSNDDRPWEYTNKGTEWRRSKVIECFVLLVNEISEEAKELEKAKKGGFADPDKALMPCVLTFQRTNYNAGRELSTFFANCKRFSAPLYCKIFNLSTVSTTNDKGTFATYAIAKGEHTPEKYFDVCLSWQNLVRGGKAKAVEVSPEETVQPKHVDKKDDRF